jgi:hypothetical protein
MRPAVFGALWCFTTLAAGYDAYFAWQHQAGFEIWELNPFICWLASVGGLKVVFGLKIVTTAFATGLALLCRWSHHWLERPLTLVVAGIFFFLSLYYVIAASKAPDPSAKIVERGRKVAGSCQEPARTHRVVLCRRAWPSGHPGAAPQGGDQYRELQILDGMARPVSRRLSLRADVAILVASGKLPLTGYITDENHPLS